MSDFHIALLLALALALALIYISADNIVLRIQLHFTRKTIEQLKLQNDLNLDDLK